MLKHFCAQAIFAQADAKDLESFIDTQLGNIDGGNDQGLSTFIRASVSSYGDRGGQVLRAVQKPAQPVGCFNHPYMTSIFLVNAGRGQGKNPRFGWANHAFDS